MRALRQQLGRDAAAGIAHRQLHMPFNTCCRNSDHPAGGRIAHANGTWGIIEKFLEEGTFAPATRARRMASLKRFFTWATKQGFCATNPLLSREPARSPVRRLPRPIQRTADLEAIDRAITHLTTPYRLIFTILRETGMRIGEVLTLQLADLCLEGGREGLRVREPKNGNERIAPLGAKATPKRLRGLGALVKEWKGQPG